MKILVLGGGNSPEREVSLRSSAGVRKALAELGHTVAFVDPADGYEAVKQAARANDLVFPILHGIGGEDGVIQAVLDEVGTPYLGSGVKASELCFDKVAVKKLLVKNGILTPRSDVVTAKTIDSSPLLTSPFVLKPVADGSSIGTLIARSLPYDRDKAQTLLAHYGEMLLEELIEGVEITVPVLGTKALPVIEIVPPADLEFDYVNKYNGATAELCPPQHVNSQVQEQAQRTAETIHALTGARHLSRTDMMVDTSGKTYVLEINTLPGLTNQSLFPRSAAVAGLPWNDLVAKFVELAQAG